MAGNITALVDSGADAFTNLYDVEITWPTTVVAGGTADSKTSVRIGNFTPPEGISETYDISYHSGKITRLKPMITLERKITLEFRVPASFDLYNNLMKWKHLWVTANTEGDLTFGSYAKDISTLGFSAINTGSIVVKAMDAGVTGSEIVASTYTGNYTPPAIWEFTDVIPLKVGTPSFTREGSDAIKITTEFLFLRMKEPGATGDNALTGTVTA